MLCCEARLRLNPPWAKAVMVFFNYSTMQMAAKVVYYGPGLCGKTTNLHYIYGHTTHDSRGEMVSLETETDRTLFFDLLPLDVGSIAGFNTRIQLYTVPGQVFYNTTRKLVLKGVDGVVFVIDSQRAMMQANLDSFRNLEENLAEMGLSVDSLPLVLQYNKRDLADIFSVDELNRSVNRQGWPWYEASAVAGQGVFETLKGISKHTLLALKKRLGRSGADAPARLSAASHAGAPASSSGAAAGAAGAQGNAGVAGGPGSQAARPAPIGAPPAPIGASPGPARPYPSTTTAAGPTAEASAAPGGEAGSAPLAPAGAVAAGAAVAAVAATVAAPDLPAAPSRDAAAAAFPGRELPQAPPAQRMAAGPAATAQPAPASRPGQTSPAATSAPPPPPSPGAATPSSSTLAASSALAAAPALAAAGTAAPAAP